MLLFYMFFPALFALLMQSYRLHLVLNTIQILLYQLGMTPQNKWFFLLSFYIYIFGIKQVKVEM
ncbi:MAG: hypothetical protein A3I83_05450 [Methylotenera sp. RIFCSPLOWO2_02_FULL_45_14]|nr:MAG: hypothetical protein A3I83_05450 [Methylotenera sp. RIFCSPLOWO2_02_FULL_45_14]